MHVPVVAIALAVGVLVFELVQLEVVVGRAELADHFETFRPSAVVAASNWENALPALRAAQQVGLPFFYEVRGFWELSELSRDDAYLKSPGYRMAMQRELEVALGAQRVFTLNTLMQGAWAALLAVLCGRDDVVFGAPVSGRFSAVAGIADHIGLFSNTVPVRMRLTADEPLIVQLERLQAHGTQQPKIRCPHL